MAEHTDNPRSVTRRRGSAEPQAPEQSNRGVINPEADAILPASNITPSISSSGAGVYQGIILPPRPTGGYRSVTDYLEQHLYDLFPIAPTQPAGYLSGSSPDYGFGTGPFADAQDPSTHSLPGQPVSPRSQHAISPANTVERPRSASGHRAASAPRRHSHGDTNIRLPELTSSEELAARRRTERLRAMIARIDTSLIEHLKKSLPRRLAHELPEKACADCEICMKDYSNEPVDPSEEAENAVELPCGHCFGEFCIFEWVCLFLFLTAFCTDVKIVQYAQGASRGDIVPEVPRRARRTEARYDSESAS